MLQSLMVPIDLGDVLHVNPSDAPYRLAIDGPYAEIVPCDEGNLVTRAVRLMERVTGLVASMDVKLRKNIPAGAGLGGGSADAAAVMLALNSLWGSPLDMAALCRIGVSIGADIPFSLGRAPAFAEGVGEVLTQVVCPSFPVVIVWPNVALGSGDVYKAFDGGFSGATPVPDVVDMDWIKSSDNDLTSAATGLCPVIGDVMAALRGADVVRMTGSGSACFGVYKAMDEAMDAASRISAAHSDWWVRAAMANPA